jgi:hypothetical protein
VANPRRFHLPLSGVGFAARVSMLPDIFIFPTGSALFIIGQLGAASLVVLGITFGLVFPKAIFDSWRRFSAPVVNHATYREG